MEYWYRRVTATIRNDSGHPLTLMPVGDFDGGRWLGGGSEPPPKIKTIASGGEQQFVVESARHSTGCEGRLRFKVGDTGKVWEIYWNNPFINACGETNDYEQTLDGKRRGVPVDQDDVDDDLAVVKYTCLSEGASDKPGATAPRAPDTQNAAAEAGKPAHVSAPAGPTIVLTLVASFPYMYGSDANEVALMAKDSWSPTLKDFEEIAIFETDLLNKQRPGSAPKPKVIVGLRGFLEAFSSLNAGVRCSRVNLITHSTSSSVALSGTVESSGRTTWMDFNESPQLSVPDRAVEAAKRVETIDNSAALKDDHGQGCFLSGAMTRNAWFHDPTKGRSDRDAIRSKMAPGAEFHVYSCDAATKEKGSLLAPAMLQLIANAFNVRTFGFTTPIFYLPKKSGPRILDRNITGLGKTEEEALTNAKPGIFHNDDSASQKALASFIVIKEPNPVP